VVIYAMVLLVGVLRLAQGEDSFDDWVASLRGGTAIALHVIVLVAFVYHTITWFSIMPKTMPPIVIAGKKLSAALITGLGLVASVALSAGLFLVVRALGS
jgi:fumarate reductase subunit C